MAQGEHRIKFSELKSRVGIDDVAYTLGYRIDRKAGVGRYIELVLGDGRDKRDTIIVRNTRDKASQTFFRETAPKVTWCLSSARTFHLSMRPEHPNGRE